MGSCSSFFNSSTQPSILSRITLSDDQINLVRKSRDDLLNYIKPSLSERFDVEVRHWMQGSFKNFTVIRPVGKFNEFDVDVGLYLLDGGYPPEYSPEDTKNELNSVLKEYVDSLNGRASVPVKRKSRCERVIFKEGFHIDIPFYYYNKERDTALLATPEKWEASDPKAFQDWFNTQTEALDRARLRRIIKYLKAWVLLKWNYTKFKPIPSMAITIYVVENFHLTEGKDEEIDFCNIAKGFVDHILTYESMINPVDGNDVLCFGRDDLEYSRNHLLKLEEISKKALETEDKIICYYLWEEIFEHLLPSLRTLDLGVGAGNLPALTTPVNILIEHYIPDGEDKVLYKKEVLERVQAYKKETIKFSIENKKDFPQNVVFKWVVRNQGKEAEDAYELGHYQKGDKYLDVERCCEYSGIQFMEVTAECDGIIIGTGRVLVNIVGYKRPPRNPPRKKYFKGRR